jgi:hypothetical protein
VISRSPINPLQAAIVAMLRADAPLTALLAKVKDLSPATPAVVDYVPEGQLYPYVRVGDHTSAPDNTHTSFGRRVTETIHVWTKVRSNGPGQTIAGRVVELLDHQPAALSARLAAAGHRCVSIRLNFDQALDDPDPEIRHHVLRFTIETAQAA